MDPSSALGRVVILKNIVAKPEFNSRYANVEEYNDERKRYLVRLIDHTSRAPPVSAWVTADKFTFVHPRRFPDHADLRELNGDEDKLLARYHTEQDSLDHPIHTSILRDIDRRIEVHVFCGKGFILGASGGGADENGLYLPRTRIEEMVDIKLNNNADILEIENVYFALGEDAGQGMCVRVSSGNLIFRRCRFDDIRGRGVYVEGTDESSSPHVVFENCVFKVGYCCEQGSASFLNCCFRKIPTAASIRIIRQSSVIVEYCDIRGGLIGIQCIGEQCEVSHSIIKDVQTGVVFFKGNCSLNDCLISNSYLHVATYGAAFSNSTIHMTRCRVEKCGGVGVNIATTGSVSLVDSVIVDCTQGVNVDFDCVGTVAVNGCTFSGNTENIAHVGQAKCVVSVDGKIFEKNGEANMEGYDLSEYIADKPESEHLIRRCLKNIGKLEFSPLCGHCGAQEPADAKYKKCSRCNKIAYCSLKCQKAAWKSHKTKCVDASLIA